MKKTTTRNLLIKISGILVLLALTACQSPFFPHYPDKGASAWPTGPLAYSPQGSQDDPHLILPSGTAVWARTTASGEPNSFFQSNAVDEAGCVYVAGWQTGNGPYTYGTQSVAGACNGNNPVLVKYDSSGAALWARSVSGTSGSYSECMFSSVAVDKSGNAIVAGYICGQSTYVFGGKSVEGVSNSYNPILIKYNSNGDVIWAKTVESGPEWGCMEFLSVAPDDKGNIYTAGYLSYDENNDAYFFGNGSEPLAAIGGAGLSGYEWSNSAPILVKYDSDGRALWAKTIESTTDDAVSAVFCSIAVQQSGSEVFIYAAGEQKGGIAGEYIQYGTADAAKLPIVSISGSNPVLAKYDSEGNAIWAKTFVQGYGASFSSVAIGQGGNVFAAGNQEYDSDYDYGNGAVANGRCQTYGYNPILVMYNSLGEAQWARSTLANPDFGSFASVAVDGSGNAYAAGYQVGQEGYRYGSIIAEGKCPGGNSLLVKYSQAGTELWVKTINNMTNNYGPEYLLGNPTCIFGSVAADRKGFVYATGTLSTLEHIDFGDGQIEDTRIAGLSETHISPVLVKYRQ